MNIKQIRKLARQHGIDTLQKKLPELICEIQRAEGNFDCFGSTKGDCDQEECLFRENCLGDQAG